MMEIVAFDSGNHKNIDDSLGNDSNISYDLPVLIEQMKKSRNWAHGDLRAMILLRIPDKQIILTAIHKETEIKSYQSSDSVSIQIIEGKLKFKTRRKTEILSEGQTLTLYENTKYSLTSKTDTVILLTILESKPEQAEN
jgi:quercetin dioxygenase-like cupin family protein